MSALSASELYRARLEKRILELSAKLEEREGERLEAHESYLSASKGKKVLEKLRERKVEEHYHQFLKNETKVIDDIAGSAPSRDRILERREL